MEERELNKEWILFHLKEGLEELSRTIGDLESNNDYTYGEFSVAMMHLYHHLNTAWNSKWENPDRVANLSEDDFYKWRAFPSDISMN